MKSKMVSQGWLFLGALLMCVTYPIVGNSQGYNNQIHNAEAQSNKSINQKRSSKVQISQPRNLKNQQLTNKHTQINRKIDGVVFRPVNAIPVYVKDKAIAKSYPNAVWYKVGESIDDGTLSQIQTANQQKSMVVPQKAISSIANSHYNVALPNTSKFRHQTIMFLGDSITKGYNGSYTYKNASFPLWVHKYLQTKVHKEGHIRSSITGHSFNDLFTILPTVNFKSANELVIEYGTNDYRHSTASLPQVEAKLTQAIKIIRKENPNIKIYGIIPLPRFDFTNMVTAQGMGGYTFPELQWGLASTYHSLGISTYNVAKVHPEFVNDNNFYTKYYDHRVHPTSQTYQQLGYYISRWLQQQFNKR
ncbi:SGNH/GDSL hydrolase family protein [Lentilactobacillus kosonis]|uniref:SGNH hydrolase-type esterase domain-containing protein n=1 Tax=Lentilactobacillus kosonis TaxID=2810561 RepID=A0A401FIQ7_9LACO|nr:SGNH/GDSL hydrolase family protein [Lentilactobacillus kosonis]GAY72253.1 hypothetical protein NBRC111893_399 [Lentilactobacillus kosonis]